MNVMEEKAKVQVSQTSSFAALPRDCRTAMRSNDKVRLPAAPHPHEVRRNP